MKALKADLHIHTNDGTTERDISYNALTLIDRAMEMGFEVLSITNHDSVTYNSFLRDYARERGILLIPGVELTVKGKHVLAYNVNEKIFSVKNFNDLAKAKRKNNLLIAPHPFFPCHKSLGRHLKKWLPIFDAIELSHFYTKTFNFNKKAVYYAEKFSLPMVGTSDCHALHQLNRTYSLIKAEKEPEAIFDAIQNGRIKIITAPLSLPYTSKIVHDLFLINAKHCLYTMTKSACLYLTSLLPRT